MTKEEAIAEIRMDICIERYMCDGCQHENCAYWLAMKALDALPSAQLSPCDVCRYYPPSAMDGKACTMCAAEGREE